MQDERITTALNLEHRRLAERSDELRRRANTALSRAFGLVVRDVVLTADEIYGLTARLLVSHQPALGHMSFIEWLSENGSTLGRAYANELNRRFRTREVPS